MPAWVGLFVWMQWGIFFGAVVSELGVRINHPLLPSVATVTEEVETPNESVEAYTGNHADRRRDRDLQSLIQPRHGV